jgi:hypothetical protein
MVANHSFESLTTPAPGVRAALLACLCAASFTLGCGEGGTDASPVTSIALIQAPATGSTIVVPVGTPPGAFVVRGSDLFPVTVSLASNRDLPFAQLNVYLLTADGYCGQNSPDSPAWRPFPKGQGVTFKVTGFQIYRLPCEVTGIRAMFHRRDDVHLGPPPKESETLAETTLSASYRLVAP